MVHFTALLTLFPTLYSSALGLAYSINGSWRFFTPVACLRHPLPETSSSCDHASVLTWLSSAQERLWTLSCGQAKWPEIWLSGLHLTLFLIKSLLWVVPLSVLAASPWERACHSAGVIECKFGFGTQVSRSIWFLLAMVIFSHMCTWG